MTRFKKKIKSPKIMVKNGFFDVFNTKVLYHNEVNRTRLAQYIQKDPLIAAKNKKKLIYLSSATNFVVPTVFLFWVYIVRHEGKKILVWEKNLFFHMDHSGGAKDIYIYFLNANIRTSSVCIWKREKERVCVYVENVNKTRYLVKSG